MMLLRVVVGWWPSLGLEQVWPVYVAMSNAVAVRPAVARRVRSPLLVGVIAAAPPPTAAPGLGHELVMEGFDLVGWGGVGGELEAISCSRMAFLLVAALARLSRALLMESRRPGLRVVAWAKLARPR
jgi:hypothetical protein